MKYLHRDNFRHLTGYGREMACFVDYVLGTWEPDDEKSPPAGILCVWRNVITNEFHAKFSPDDSNRSEPYRLAGRYERTTGITLSLMTDRCGICEVVSVPLVMVMNNVPDYSKCYQVYQHSYLTDPQGERITNACYTGVTRRGWRNRWAEHLRAANAGSHYRFHRAIREWHNCARFSVHMVAAVCESESLAMEIEEALVERDSLYPLGLNMIPGGKSGLAYLRKIGALGASERVSADDKHAIVNRFFERAARKGLPNPLAAANWLNPDYAERVICSAPDRLKPQQIRDARFLSSIGREASDIAAQIGARSASQVARLLAGETYSRVL